MCGKGDRRGLDIEYGIFVIISGLHSLNVSINVFNDENQNHQRVKGNTMKRITLCTEFLQFRRK